MESHVETQENRSHEKSMNSELIQVEATDLSFDTVPDSLELKKKVNDIEEFLLQNPSPPLGKLKNFALSEGGLVCDEVRRKVWPLLLSLDPEKAEPAPALETLRAHPEYQQVVLDVNRSLKRFPPGIPYNRRVALQDQLTTLILRVISKYPHLRYYQGYHDVAVTFLLVVGEDAAFQIMERLSTDHLKDCMEPTMDRTSYLLNYIFPLIHRLHPALCEFLDRSCVGTMFCLPWYLTWYSHSLNRYRDVVRLYDYFLASPPLLPLYLVAAIVAHRQDELFSVDCDMATVHCLLSNLSDDLPFEKLLSQATDLYDKFPPESIEPEVKERCQLEAQKRQQEEAERKALVRRRGRGRGDTSWVRRLWAWQPPVHIPNYKMLILTASVAFGFYAYLKAGPDAIDFTPR
ncbi:TBC1 domain family member 20-like [Macrosteles quadrilineatus]|uniref:TBC1 domain family member 20-like n=1 Tax=Macrosteles quadrilineatus TaxID=74068 RepID=UPI0023E136A5|nr:TBC1 domain family member 20-like [Macrosteles quadrilineatus]